MNESSTLLANTIDKLFGDVAASGLTPADTERFARGNLPAEAWRLIEANGIAAVLLPEESGGFGGSWCDAATVARAAGAYALPLPVVDTLCARYLLHRAGIAIPGGALALAIGSTLNIEGGSVSGCIDGVAWAQAADHMVVANANGAIALVEPTAVTRLERRRNIPGEPVADLGFAGSRATACGEVDDDAFGLRALLCVAQIGGALAAALQQSVTHVNEREQFGKPIGRQQAIQQSMAVFASETAAIHCAAVAASRAADRGAARFEIAAAKLRANRAIGIATSIAHQVHGAIGFTREHRLHRLTQRLWQWRSDYGNDRYWARELGTMIAQGGPDGFWRDLTARGDRA